MCAEEGERRKKGMVLKKRGIKERERVYVFHFHDPQRFTERMEKSSGFSPSIYGPCLVRSSGAVRGNKRGFFTEKKVCYFYLWQEFIEKKML